MSTRMHASADIDREIVLTRVIDAPIEAVFDAFTADDIESWWGPSGFRCTRHERDVREGGTWRFDLVAPDGHVYPNRIVYREITRPHRIVFDHGDDVDDDPQAFLVTVTFDAQDDGKTVLTMRQLHPTVEQRATGIGFGAVELGHQTLDKLAARLAG